MSEKKSSQNTMLLRLDPESYFLIDLAVPYWKKYNDGADKSRQGLIRRAAEAFAIQILKGEGVYEKAVENFRLEMAGKEILDKQEKETKENELP
jgi:hypothetical protein